MQSLANVYEQRPSIAVTFVLLLSALALGGWLRLSFEDEPRNIFRRDDTDFARMEQLFDEFHVYDNDILLVVEADDLFAPQSIDALRSLVNHLRTMSNVSTTYSLLDARRPSRPGIPLIPYPPSTATRLERARRDAHAHSAMQGRMISDDDRTTLVVATIAGNSLDVTTMEATVDPIRSLASDLSANSPLRIMVTGMGVRVDVCLGGDHSQPAAWCWPPVLVHLWPLGRRAGCHAPPWSASGRSA